MCGISFASRNIGRMSRAEAQARIAPREPLLDVVETAALRCLQGQEELVAGVARIREERLDNRKRGLDALAVQDPAFRLRAGQVHLRGQHERRGGDALPARRSSASSGTARCGEV